MHVCVIRIVGFLYEWARSQYKTAWKSGTLSLKPMFLSPLWLVSTEDTVSHTACIELTSLAFAIDAKDHYTQGHSQKVSAYAALIAEAMGMNELEIEEIRLGGVERT